MFIPPNIMTTNFSDYIRTYSNIVYAIIFKDVIFCGWKNFHVLFLANNPVTLHIFVLVYFMDSFFRGTFLIGFACSLHTNTSVWTHPVWVKHMSKHVLLHGEGYKGNFIFLIIRYLCREMFED